MGTENELECFHICLMLCLCVLCAKMGEENGKNCSQKACPPPPPPPVHHLCHFLFPLYLSPFLIFHSQLVLHPSPSLTSLSSSF